MKVLSIQHYTPNTVDFSGILRNVNAATPDFVFVASYPVESAALIRGISEIGIADSVQMFGGALVGVQYAQQLESLGSALNGVTNYDFYVVAPTMNFPGIDQFLERYRDDRRKAEGRFARPLPAAVLLCRRPIDRGGRQGRWFDR